MIRPWLQAVITRRVVYLLRDRFGVGGGALLTGRATPGPGARTVTDVESVITAANGYLRGGAQASAVWGDARVMGDGLARKQGRAVAWLVTLEDSASDSAYGLFTSATPTTPNTAGHGWMNVDGTNNVLTPGQMSQIDTGNKAIRSMQYLIVVVLQAEGAYVFLSSFAPDTGRGMNDPIGIPQFPALRLLSASNRDTTTTLYPGMLWYDRGSGGAGYPGGHAVMMSTAFDLDGGTWKGQNALATLYDSLRGSGALGTAPSGGTWSAVSGVFERTATGARLATATGGYDIAILASGPANALVRCRVRWPSAGTPVYGIAINYQSPGNYIRIGNLGNNAIALYEVVGGVQTAIHGAGFAYPADGILDLQHWREGNRTLVAINDAVQLGPSWQTYANNLYAAQTGYGIVGVGLTNRVVFENFAVFEHTTPAPVEVRLGPHPNVIPAGATLGSDTFTDTNGTNITAHTPDTGSAWTVGAGTWTIQSNALVTVSIETNKLVWQECSTPDIQASATITIPAVLPFGLVRAGLAFRIQDASNYLWVRLYRDNTAQPGAPEIEIGQTIAGVSAIVHKAPLPDTQIAVNTAYVLMVRCKGLQIDVLLDGLATVSYVTDQFLTSTKHGLYMNGGVGGDDGCTIDGWEVKAL